MAINANVKASSARDGSESTWPRVRGKEKADLLAYYYADTELRSENARVARLASACSHDSKNRRRRAEQF